MLKIVRKLREDYNTYYMVKNPYDMLKEITDAVYAGERDRWGDSAVQLLINQGIKLRDKDGDLYSKNFSIPKSQPNCYVLGLRYKKKDGTFTEDLFLFSEGSSNITPYYKGKLEKKLTEYRGTHKWQP